MSDDHPGGGDAPPPSSTGAGRLGTLFVVATPIGNLEDLTSRARRVLSEVSWILAEDTRVTRKLCQRHEITARMLSLHDHNEEAMVTRVVALLEAGEDLALVSDAGTPLISDPGFRIVRALSERGLKVSPVPGPSSVLAALAVAGLPTDAFTFRGYFPRKESEAARVVLAGSDGTLVFLEAPHRLEATLGLLARLAPTRATVVARELTKIHEQVVRGTPAAVLAALPRPVRGEIVLLLGPAAANVESPLDPAALYAELVAAGTSRNEALREVSRRTGMRRRDVYRLVSGAG